MLLEHRKRENTEKKTVMAADRRSSTNNRDKGEDLRAYFGNCDGDVMNIASPEVQTYK